MLENLSSLRWPWKERTSARICSWPDVDDSEIAMPPALMRQLRLLNGDMVWVQFNGNKRVFSVKRFDYTEIRVSLAYAALSNLEAQHGDMVTIAPCKDVLEARRIALFPTVETEKYAGSLFCDFLSPYFQEKYRFIREGDVIKIPSGERYAEFDVLTVEPDDCGIVSFRTQIDIATHVLGPPASSGQSLNPLDILRELRSTIDHATSARYGTGIAVIETLICRLEALLQAPPMYGTLDTYRAEN